MEIDSGVGRPAQRDSRDSKRVRAVAQHGTQVPEELRGGQAAAAGFSLLKAFEELEFLLAHGVTKKALMELSLMAFADRAGNVVLLGPAGLGKTTWTEALVHAAGTARSRCPVHDADPAAQCAAQRPCCRLLRAGPPHSRSPWSPRFRRRPWHHYADSVRRLCGEKCRPCALKSFHNPASMTASSA